MHSLHRTLVALPHHPCPPPPPYLPRVAISPSPVSSSVFVYIPCTVGQRKTMPPAFPCLAACPQCLLLSPNHLSPKAHGAPPPGASPVSDTPPPRPLCPRAPCMPIPLTCLLQCLCAHAVHTLANVRALLLNVNQHLQQQPAAHRHKDSHRLGYEQRISTIQTRAGVTCGICASTD
jgi:hypothetical protein